MGPQRAPGLRVLGQMYACGYCRYLAGFSRCGIEFTSTTAVL